MATREKPVVVAWWEVTTAGFTMDGRLVRKSTTGGAGMAKIDKWCASSDEKVKSHNLRTLEADPSKISTGIEAVAKIVPNHYASEERIARLMRRLGKTKAAKYITDKLPSSKSLRSGDLGEILGASYVTEFMNFPTGIKRLRWKDHRNMAMRGDDIIAVDADSSTKKIRFLKGEVKSSASLSAATVSKARTALRKDNNRPSPHALSFLADRLYENGQIGISDLIEEAQLGKGIKLSQVSHLMFTFSGNDPAPFLRNDLNAYKGKVPQHSVGLRVHKHQAFIKAVYKKVIANGGKP